MGDSGTGQQFITTAKFTNIDIVYSEAGTSPKDRAAAASISVRLTWESQLQWQLSTQSRH